MLILKTKATIADSGEQVYIEFRNATGDYDSIDNPGGFGGINPGRDDLAVLIWAVHKLTPGDQEADLLAYDPLSVTSFTINITKPVNGVLNYFIVALPFYDDGESYNNGDIVYDNENPAAPFIKEYVSGAWVPRLLEEILGDEDAIQVEEYKFPIPDACVYLDQLNGQKLELVRSVVKRLCDKEQYFDFLLKFGYAESLMLSAQAAFNAQAYAEAQSYIDELFNLESVV